MSSLAENGPRLRSGIDANDPSGQRVDFFRSSGAVLDSQEGAVARWESEAALPRPKDNAHECERWPTVPAMVPGSGGIAGEVLVNVA